MFVAIIPQSIVFYKIQKEAFEVLVSNTPDSRKLSYYSSSLLSKENIKDVQLYGLYDFFIDKYKDTFKRINKGIKLNRVKKLAASVSFLIVSTAISVFVFNTIIKGAFSGAFFSRKYFNFFVKYLIYNAKHFSFGRRFKFIV